MKYFTEKRAALEKLINRTKAKVKDYYLEKYGYLFCVDCKKRIGRIHMSHTISVKKCIERGEPEKAYAFDNIKPRCENCHDKLDKTYIVKW